MYIKNVATKLKFSDFKMSGLCLWLRIAIPANIRSGMRICVRGLELNIMMERAIKGSLARL